MLSRILILVCLPMFCLAQLPQSNIYHFTLTKVSNDYRVKSPQFLTQFNKLGYNNQPAYFDDKVIYFATDYYDKAQTEIAKFDLFSKTLTRVSYTPEQEYSPTPMYDKEKFSVVRVEQDKKTQTLSVYPLDGIGYAKRYMNNTNNIGYHNWLDAETVGLFLVEEPHHNLAIANASSEKRKIVLDKVGRCLKSDKAGNLVFVHKMNDGEWYIKNYNILTSKSSVVVKTLEGAEDFEILNDGSYLMGTKSQLFRYVPGKSKDWQLVADLEGYGISNIQRIASRKNSLVIVDSL